jgi:hypothetical protein
LKHYLISPNSPKVGTSGPSSGRFSSDLIMDEKDSVKKFYDARINTRVSDLRRWKRFFRFLLKKE